MTAKENENGLHEAGRQYLDRDIDRWEEAISAVNETYGINIGQATTNLLTDEQLTTFARVYFNNESITRAELRTVPGGDGYPYFLLISYSDIPA